MSNMWKAAFTGRSEAPAGAGGSASGRPSKDRGDEPRRKKSSHGHRAESVISSASRRDDDRDRERRRSGKAAGSLYENGSSASRYETASSYASPNTSAYATAPTSRVGETRPLTESALRMLPNDDDEEWEDEDKDARSEKKSRRKGSGDEKRRKSTRSEKDRSRSRSRERKEKKKESSRAMSISEKPRERERDKDKSRRQPELVAEGSRAIPEMGSFEQFPGQYASGYMGPPPQQEAMMSGALPSPAPQQQFPGQDYYRPQMPAQPTRADSYGQAADYYLDEGQSVQHQPGNRPFTPNMLVNPDAHLQAASAQANPAQDTGHGSAADFYGGKVSPVYSAPTTPAKPLKPGKQYSSSTGKIKPSRTSSTGTAAAATAAVAGVAALAGSSHHHSSSMQQSSSSSYYQQTGGSSSKPSRPNRPNSDGDVYYATPSNGTYPPTLASTNGYGPTPYSDSTGAPGKNSTNSNLPLYAAGAAAAGLAAHEYSQHQHNGAQSNGYNMTSAAGYGGGGQGPPGSPRPGAGGYGYYPPNGAGGMGMQHQHIHEHKGPLTRIKDGFFNLISSPEDTAKMEMYTEYIGVCKHCFDPRTSPGDAPRVHHYHKRRDSFEDLRKRRSYDRMTRKGSNDSLRRQGSARVDKDSRYYASDGSRRKRESGGVGILGTGLAVAGAAAGANALFGDRKNFDDTYSVKSGHRESSAVRRRSRSSSRERRRRSAYGIVRPEKEEYVNVRRKDGTIDRRRVAKSRSTSRDRRSGYLGAAAGLAASSRRHSKSRSRSRSPTILGSFGAADVRSRRSDRRSPTRSSHQGSSRYEAPQEEQGFFGGFFSPPQRKHHGSGEHRKQRRGFFTFSNGSSSSSNSELAFGDGFSSKTSLPLRRKASSGSNRTGRRRSRRNSDEHIAATVAGIGATAAALAAAKKGGRISKRTSRPELGKRRDVRYSTGPDRRHDDTVSSEDGEWEDELPSDVDDESSVDGGLAFGDYRSKRLSSRQSLESVGSQSSAGGLGAWGWRWGGKDQKRRTGRPSHQGSTAGSFAGPAAGVAADAVAGAAYGSSRPINKPVYLDDSGRPLPSIDSTSTVSGPSGPMQYVDPAPISDPGSLPGSRYPSMPGAFDEEPPIIRPGPGPLQQPQPMSPARAAFTQSPPDLEDFNSGRPGPLRRANSSPTRGTLAQDAALIGAGALATAGILAGASSRRSKEPSNVRFGLTDEQQRRDDRDRRKEEQKGADEERRCADRTRALKEEADRAARESRQEEVRRAREEENRKAAEAALERQRAAQREAEDQARREREREASRVERERLEQEARDRKEAAAAAAAEVEKHQKAREEAQRQAEARERERREWEEAHAREQSRLAEEARRKEESDRQRELQEKDRYMREQAESYQQESKNGEHERSSGWGSVAAGAAAAATVGAVMAGKEHKKSRNRDRKRRDDSYYDEAHSDRQDRWQTTNPQDYSRECREKAELDRRTSNQYARNPAGAEYHDDYTAAEIKPKNEHSGEPLTDDDIYNPNFFKEKHTPAENAKYAEFARKAADRVVAEREDAYNENAEKTNYADFFAPKDLLSKAAEGKTRSVSPVGDNDVQVWHARDAEIQSHFGASDYGYGRSKHAPYGVPKLNVISPTPPPGSVSTSPESKRNKGAFSHSPLSKSQDADVDDFNKTTASGKSERSRSISWGEDKTHVYDVQTPDSYQERDSYVTSPDTRGEYVAAGLAGVAAGAALHDIVVEEPSGAKRIFHEDEWVREERKSNGGRKLDDDEGVEDITPSTEPEPRTFYRQPFFDSVSDMGTGVFGMESPGTEGAPPQRGFVEGETEEPTPIEEKRQRIPGGFDDDMEDIYRPKRKPSDPVTAEMQTDQATAGAAEEPKVEEPAWEPPLSKKEKKKRDKAAKRDSLAEFDPPTPAKETEPEPAPLPSSATIPEPESTDYFSGMSKKEKKKAKKQGLADIASSMMSEPVKEPDYANDAPTPVAETEPPLSKKEQKKRDKEARKQGSSFADVTDTILAAGGIAAAAVALESTEDSGSGSGKKKKKTKLGESIYDDPRDAALNEPVDETKKDIEEPAGMLGSWANERESMGKDVDERSPIVDPFEYQVDEGVNPPTAPEAPAAQESDPWAEFAEPKSKKKKKKNKRSSIAFNIPEVSSPLRSEIPMDDYVSAMKPAEEARSSERQTYVNGSQADAMPLESAAADAGEEKPLNGRTGSSEASSEDKRRGSDSPRQISPDDSKSVASAPTPDGESRRRSRREESRSGDYFDEPSYAYETRSIAASEPADLYESSKKSKRRSRHADDDDTATVVSSRSRREREKDESPSSSKKEKKGGLFGLFSRKSVDDSRSSSGKDKDTRSDGAPLSRESTRDSRGSREEEDDEGRRRRNKKSRDSQYGDDDDDTRSVKSESRHSRHRSEEGFDDESREHRRRSTRDDNYDVSLPARSESGRKHHHRRRTDDDGEDSSGRDGRDDSRSVVSESGRRHHHRRRTDEDKYRSDSKDQSFLGMRVEDMPPLPDSRPVSPDLAAEKQERGEGSPADAEPGSGLVNPLDHTEADLAKELLDTPAAVVATPPRPASVNRPTSTTAVPLRFPGQAPQTPGSAKDRSHSFSSPIATAATPTSPAGGKQSRQGRPHSSEFRPLYLVERNRKTPEVEDTLPSLPSSKPSSRASSIHGSDDNYQSAVEEFEADSPSGSRNLTIDTSAVPAPQPGDFLDSAETTPKASQFPQTVHERHAKQEPQFYTWEDFARDERLHDEQQNQPEEPVTATREEMPSDLPPLSQTRSKSPSKRDHGHDGSFKSVAAAAMLGTAAVYAHHKYKDRSPERFSERQAEGNERAEQRDETQSAHSYPLPAPVEEPVIETEKEPVQQTSVSRKSTKKKGKKGKRQSSQVEEPEMPGDESGREASAPPLGSQPTSEVVAGSGADMEPLDHRNTNDFLHSEAQAEEGDAVREVAATPEEPIATSSSRENALDRFLHSEQDMEEGMIFPSAASHTMPFLQPSEVAEQATKPSSEETGSPSAPYKIPTAKAEPAPLEVEQQTAEAGPEDESKAITPAPQLTRKQSKKAKKKQKAVALFEPETIEEPQTTTEALPENGPQDKDVTWDDEVPNARDHRTEDSEPTTAPDLAPRINFGMLNFHEVAHDSRSRWHDSQAESFQAMLRDMSSRPEAKVTSPSSVDQEPIEKAPMLTADDTTVEADPQLQEASFEQPVSKKKSKKDKKKKTLTWCDLNEPSEPASPETPEQPADDDIKPESKEDQGSGALVAAGLAAAAGAASVAEVVSKESKNKSKKDKRKKSLAWSDGDVEPEVETPAESEQRDLGAVQEDPKPTVANDAVAESFDAASLPAVEEPVPAAVVGERDLPTEQAAEPRPAEEIFPATSKKKSKKDKKKALAWNELESVDSPPPEPEVASLPIEETQHDVGQLDTAKEMTVEQPEASTDAAGQTAETPVVDEAFAPVATKKSKKDKKKKKTYIWDEPEPEAGPTVSNEENKDHVEQPGIAKEVPLDPPVPEPSIEEPAHISIEHASESPEQPAEDLAQSSDAAVDTETFTTESDKQLEEVRASEEPVSTLSRKQSKKDKKKQQKAAAWAEPDPEPRLEPTKEPALDQMDADDAAFVDATETQPAALAEDVPQDESPTDRPLEEMSKADEMADGCAALKQSEAQDEPESFAPASRKKSKKDKKKKKKVQSWAADEPEPEPETTLESASRSLSVDDTAFVDANETQAQADEPAVEQGSTYNLVDAPADVPSVEEAAKAEEPAQSAADDVQAESSRDQESQDFAPVSRKASKKDKKKKKQQQAFDWDTPESTAVPETPFDPSKALPPPAEDLAIANPEFEAIQVDETPANDFNGLANDKLASEDVSSFEPQPESATLEEEPSESASASEKKRKKDKENKKQVLDWDEPEPSAVTAPDEQAQPISEAQEKDLSVEDAPESEEPSDLPAEPRRDDQQDLDEAAAAVEQAIQLSEAAPEPASDDLATVVKKKSKKDKKRRQTLDWTEPEASTAPEDAAEADPPSRENEEQPESQAVSKEAVTEAIEDSEVVEDASKPSQQPVSEPPLEEFAPALSGKKSKKKKKASQSWDFTEPDSASTADPELSANKDDVYDLGEQAEASVPTVLDERSADAVISPEATREPTLEDSAPVVSKKKSKKDKKKKKSGAFEWADPESESTPMPESRDETQEAEEPADDLQLEKSDDLAAAQDEATTEATKDTDKKLPSALDMPAVAEAVADPEPFEGSSSAPSRKQSKKDKKKKKRQEQSWEPEPETLESQVPAESAQDTLPPEFATSKPAEEQQEIPQDIVEEADRAPAWSQTDGNFEDGQRLEAQTEEMPKDSTSIRAEDEKSNDGVAERDVPSGDQEGSATPPEADEWSWTSSSKKSKKNRNNRKSTPEISPTEQPAETVQPGDSGDAPASPKAAGPSWDDMVTEEQVAAFEPPVDEEPKQISTGDGQAQDESSWATTLKKNSSKGKKGRQSIAEIPPEQVEEPLGVSAEPEQQAQTADDAIDAGVTRSLEPEPQDDVWGFSTKSKKKGKKAKKTKSSGTATPVTEETPAEVREPSETAIGEDATAKDPVLVEDNNLPAASLDQETTEVSPVEEPQSDFWTAPIKQKKSKKSKASTSEATGIDTPDEPADLVAGKRAMELEPAFGAEPEAVASGTHNEDSVESSTPAEADPWANNSLKKKKGKKGKKSGSGLATPTTLEPTPPSDPSPELPAEDATFTEGIQPVQLQEEASAFVPPENTNEAAPAEDIMDEAPPVDPTFDDVWAEEDLATHHDHDTVRDLFGDPSEATESTWQPLSSKKSKNKGKRGSVAATAPEPEPETALKDKSSQLEREPVADSEGIAFERSIANVEASLVDREAELLEDPERPITLDQEPENRDISSFGLAEQQTSETAVEPAQEISNLDQQDWFAPQSGNKSKKNKKNKQAVLEDSQASADLPKPDNADFTPASEPTAEQPTQEPADAQPIDDWAVPAKGKKGKKSKKVKQTISWGDETPAEDSNALAATPEASSAGRDQHIAEKGVFTRADESEQHPVLQEPPVTTEEPESWENADKALSEPARDLAVGELGSEEPAVELSAERPLESAIPVQETVVPEDEANESSFTMKSKKDKKKGKKNRSSTTDSVSEAAPDAALEEGKRTENDSSKGDLLGAAATATAIAAGAMAKGSAKPEPEGDEWSGFSSKKSKKDKKKARKSGPSTPVTAPEDSAELSRDVMHEDSQGPASVNEANVDSEYQDGAKPASDIRDAEHAWSYPENNNAEAANLDESFPPAHDTTQAHDYIEDGHFRQANNEHAHHGSFNEVARQEHAQQQTPAGTIEEDPTTTNAPHHPPHDIDFTATVAAGLADTGFNPDLVINDPIFQHRASPTGSNGEADPDEISASTTTRRRKGKKSPEATRSPENGPVTHAADTTNDSVPADDFNNTISQSLTNTGFDPALLESALASSNAQPSGETAGNLEDFSSITTTKRKKGKEGKKSKLGFESDDSPAAGSQSTDLDRSIDPAKDDHDGLTARATSEGLQASEDTPLDEYISMQDQTSRSIPNEQSEIPMADGNDPQPSSNDFLGREEMDMDEMDRQYREYRKNKRKQKKLKAASRAAGSSDNPESSTAVSDSDALPVGTVKSTALARKAILEEASKADSAQQPEQVQSPQSPTNSRSIVQSAFPGLERIKRRAPSIPSANDATERRSSSSSHREGLLQHTSEVSQLLPVAVPRSPPPSDKARTENGDGSHSSPQVWAAAGAAGFGAAVAAAAREREARKSAKNEPTWSFSPIEHETPTTADKEYQPIRDSGYQETKRSSKATERSSREIPEILHTSSSRDSLRERRSLDPLRISTSPDDSWDVSSPQKMLDDGRNLTAGSHSRTPSAETPLKPTSKERVSYLFQSPPDNLAGVADTTPRSADSSAVQQKSPGTDYFKTRSSPRGSSDNAVSLRDNIPERATFSPSNANDGARDRSAFSPVGGRERSHDRSTFSPNGDNSHDRSTFSPVHGPRSPSVPLDAIPEELHVGKRRKPESDVGGPSQVKAIQRAETPQSIRAKQNSASPSIQATMNIPMGSARSTSNPLSTDTLINRLSWPSVDEDQDTVHIDRPLGHRYSKAALPDPRSPSVMSNQSNTSGTHFKSPLDMRSYSRNSNQSSTPSLRRTSLSGDLRAVSRRGDASGSGSAVGAAASPKTIPFEPPPTPPPNDDDLIHGSASRAADMNDDVFQGFGDAQRSQVSPTRPPSVRKRQSMHIGDLESRIAELAAENRALQEAREYAEQTNDAARDVNGQALQEAIAARDQQLQEKDAEINQIKAMLQPLQEEVAHLMEINGGLTEANRNLVDDTNGRYATLQAEHADAHEKWQSTSRDLETMRSEHGRVTSGMRDIIEAEIASSLADKNAEILRLREQLDIAAEQIRSLQVQIQSSKSSDWLVQRDEDYFDGACQKLCQHVQQWVLRFSKLSDNRVCRLSTELKDDKLEARLDNAILDGSDVDKLLSDRVRRRDVFMSVVMTMVWEYVFTRYLFGMDREQRQKLKVLEKVLAETGPPRAVAHWRATTLTLLSKRPSFATQCGLDTEAVAHEIFQMLCSLLPPPQNAEQQLFASLQKVMGIAVNLSVEMRTQRAEYIMLPPLQPEYDTNGDLVRKVHFNADLMNERSGFFQSNEELAADHAVVKIVLFPLVVKKGDDNGEGDEEIVVCPAQVLVQNDGGRGKKVVRVMSGALPMDVDHPMGSRQSRHSLVSEAPGSVGF